MAGTSRDDAPDLPGFYYDPERRRYFRVLPGVNNHNPLTKKMISEKKAQSSTSNQNLTKKRIVNMMHFLEKRTSGSILKEKFIEESIHCKLSCCHSKFPVFQDPSLEPRGAVRRFQPDANYKTILEFTSTASFSSTSYVTLRKKGRLTRVANNNTSSTFCFLEMENKRMIMYANVDVAHPRITLIDANSNRMYDVKCHNPWSCASAKIKHSKYQASFSDGRSTNFISNIDAFLSRNPAGGTIHPRGPYGTVVRLPSDVSSQQFSPRPDVHFNGLRTGRIIGLDTRIPQRKIFCCVFNEPTKCNVCHMHTLCDSWTVLAGYKSPGIHPKMFLWDMRFTRKPVFQLKTDFEKRHAAKDSPLFSMNVDRYDRTVTSVLPDCRARSWSLKTGEMAFVYPEKTEDESIVTAAAYTNDWELFNGKCGVLVYTEQDGYKFMDFAS